MTVDLREAVARLISPGSWAVMGGYLADVKRKHKGEKVGYDADAFKHKESLATADTIISLVRPALSPPAEGVSQFEQDKAKLRSWIQPITPTPAPVDWERVGPKLVEAGRALLGQLATDGVVLECMAKPTPLIELLNSRSAEAVLTDFRAALAAAQPEGK